MTPEAIFLIFTFAFFIGLLAIGENLFCAALQDLAERLFGGDA